MYNLVLWWAIRYKTPVNTSWKKWKEKLKAPFFQLKIKFCLLFAGFTLEKCPFLPFFSKKLPAWRILYTAYLEYSHPLDSTLLDALCTSKSFQSNKAMSPPQGCNKKFAQSPTWSPTSWPKPSGESGDWRLTESSFYQTVRLSDCQAVRLSGCQTVRR